LFFLLIISWPFKLIGKIIFKYFFVNIFRLYLYLKRICQLFLKSGNQKRYNSILKNIPLLFFVFFIIWSAIDKIQIEKLTADEIGKKSILYAITANPEDYENTEEITEGPLALNQQNNSSYLEGEVVKPKINLEHTITSDHPLATQDDTTLVAPIAALPTASTRTEIINYQIQNGDSIGTIAQKLGINVTTILWANNLAYNSLIKPGQILKILPVSGITYQIKKGDKLSAIAKNYQADLNKILEFNKLADATSIKVGQNIIIPGGVKPTVIVAKPAPTIKQTIKNIFTPPPAASSNTRFQWPAVSHYITQYFGWRHTGLDIGDKTGDPIYAAEDGLVEASGWNKGGYGNYIIINHGGGYKTLYGHASKLLVSAGDTVSRGQVIGLIGSTGRSTGPHLHFEVRVNGSRVNPLGYIR
jgi:LysM repeat protein